jgi:Leucine-rich repeat (LRR) protein
MNTQYLKEAKRYGVKSLDATSVAISGKNLTSIPRFIFNMPNLKSLDLSVNKIESVPDKIGTLKNLEELFMSSNKITSLPSTIGSLKNLTRMVLLDNNLTSVPALMFNARKLHSLDFRMNTLTSVPETIGNLKALEYLYLDDNEMTSLPESIGNLTSLKTMGLGDNRLSRLPESIGNLANIKNIFLNGNPLVSVPVSMSKLPSNVTIEYDRKYFKLPAFLELFKPKIIRKNAVRVNNKTNVYNANFSEVRLSNVPPNRRAFINTKSNVMNEGTLRRVYNVNALMKYMRGKRSGTLYGGNFTSNNIQLLKNVPHTVNKSAYLKNIKNRLTNTSTNNMVSTITALKNQLPTNVNKNDVNRLAKNVARNRVKNATTNTRNRVIKALRNKGLLTNEDVKKFEPK